jgi:4-aminobutyrate aminotransferase-like enzyme
MGRTGKMFAFEHSGVEPDLLCVAKSIAAGLPLSALVGKAELMDKIAAGGMGSTYGGNPVACAAALAVLDIFEEEKLLDRAGVIGRKVGDSWRALMNGPAKGRFGDVRQIGGMIAVECVKDGDPHKPDADLASKIQTEARDRGLILTTAGAYAQCLRCLTPLTISDATLDEGLAMFADATKAAVAG